ncbi:hypothetical protein GX586_11245, partial [bacterium]|nr:hypothetical protein [bacterium]
MGYAYTPGLKVLAATTIRRCRRLPLPGAVLVRAGDRVGAEQVVMRTELPGPADMVNLVSMLGVMPAELPRYVVRKVGDSIAKGDLLAESKGFLGLFKTRIEAPMAGTIEAISPVTGQMTVRSPAVPVEVHAYIDGVVAEVVDTESVTVETSGAFIQGIFGVGGETNGVIAMIAERPDEPMDPARITPAHKGAVL